MPIRKFLPLDLFSFFYSRAKIQYILNMSTSLWIRGIGGCKTQIRKR